MRKLVKGVVDFHSRVRPVVRDDFAQLALGQLPDVLFIACSDSRVAANVFASTDPGDLFVVRNVGNMVPPACEEGRSVGDESEMAAIEFALLRLGVRHIVICGHSECGAMHAIAKGRLDPGMNHLESWLRHGSAVRERVKALPEVAPNWPLAPHNRMSQLNVLLQIEHLLTYPLVSAAVSAGKLQLHSWWFDIAEAEVSAYDQDSGSFVVIDANSETRYLDSMSKD